MSVTDTVMMFIFSPSAPPFFYALRSFSSADANCPTVLIGFANAHRFALSDVKELRF